MARHAPPEEDGRDVFCERRRGSHSGQQEPERDDLDGHDQIIHRVEWAFPGQCVNTGWKAVFHMPKVRWGVLGVAGIAVNKVIPAMQQGADTEITAIASRDLAKAQRAARQLGIAKTYGSYDELLADREIDAIYNPLPNHLHLPWSIKAAEAGKHVLCEKPIGLSVDEAKKLRDVRDRTGVKIGEAFMVRTHPQWIKALELVRAGLIGELRSMMGFFSYSNLDPANIRNILAYGGGGLMDIGCYPIFTSCFIFGAERPAWRRSSNAIRK